MSRSKRVLCVLLMMVVMVSTTVALDLTPIWTTDNIGVVQDIRIADLDGDDDNEVVVAVEIGYGVTSPILIYDGESQTLLHTLWLPSGYANQLAVYDIDLDGQKEIIAGTTSSWEQGAQGYVHVFNASTLDLEWSSENLGSIACMHLADLDADGEPEVFLGIWRAPTQQNFGKILVLNGISHAIEFESNLAENYFFAERSAFANIDSDPAKEIVFGVMDQALSNTYSVIEFDGASHAISMRLSGNGMFRGCDIGSMDSDTPAEIVIGFTTGTAASDQKRIVVFDLNWAEEWSFVLPDAQGYGPFSPVVGDVTGDGVGDIICGVVAENWAGDVIFIDGRSRTSDWLSGLGGGLASVEVIRLGDINENGLRDICIGRASGTSSGFLEAFETIAPVSPAWCDNFEQYPSENLSTSWTASGNATSVSIDSSISYGGSKSVSFDGVRGGCWGTVRTRPLGTTYPMTIEVAVRNGSEALSGCHAFRSDLILRPGPNWWEAGLPLFMFLANGDLRITFAQPETDFTGYNLEQWYKIRIALFAPGDGLLHARFSVDGSFLGEFSRPWENWMANDELVSIQVEEGSAWFDDVCVSPGIDFKQLILPAGDVQSCQSDGSVQPVQVAISEPIVAMNIPLRIPNGVTDVSVSCAGLVTEGWDELAPPIIDPVTGLVRLVLASSPLVRLEPGTHIIANIHYKAAPLCNASRFIQWDTTLSNDPERKLAFSDTLYQTIIPEFRSDSTEIRGYKPGDINASSQVDLSDLSLLIAYLTQTPKPTLCQPLAANCTGVGAIDLSDLSILIAYLTTTPRPALKCAPATIAAAKPGSGFEVSCKESATSHLLSINSAESVRGLLLRVKTTGQIHSKFDSGIDIISERSGDELTILAIDLQGEAIIGSGLTDAFSFDAPVEVLSAEASTLDFTTIYASLGSSTVTLPAAFGLSQNYPNPFNPATEISYSLPQASHVKLVVYNITGQVVATLVDTDQETGSYSVRWDAGPYSSGVYLYRLTAGEYAETKKMLLIK